MSRFRKVDTRTYADLKFRQLSKPQPCGQYLWLWLLTGPVTCQIPGVIFNVGARGMAELLGWEEKGFREAFQEVLSLGMAEADFDAPLVFIPNAIKYNAPQSPNVVTAWTGTWEEVPECELKQKIRQTLGAFMETMSEGFQEAFDKACPKPMPNQEQEQEQEQTGAGEKQNQNHPPTAVGSDNSVNGIDGDPLGEWTIPPRDEWPSPMMRVRA